jgi:hypothetical protein
MSKKVKDLFPTDEELNKFFEEMINEHTPEGEAPPFAGMFIKGLKSYFMQGALCAMYLIQEKEKGE